MSNAGKLLVASAAMFAMFGLGDIGSVRVIEDPEGDARRARRRQEALTGAAPKKHTGAREKARRLRQMAKREQGL